MTDAEDDTDVEDIRRRSNATSINGPVSDAVVQGHRSSAEGHGDGMAEHGETSRYKDIPVDFSEVQTRLLAGQYTSIVRTLLMVIMTNHLG